MNQNSALLRHCFRNHFNIILPSMPAWPFFCFIHKLLHYEWTCYTLVNTELDLCTNRRDCKQWWIVNITHQQSTKFQRTKFRVTEELAWNICTVIITLSQQERPMWFYEYLPRRLLLLKRNTLLPPLRNTQHPRPQYGQKLIQGCW
jgi:hypothetical protein